MRKLTVLAVVLLLGVLPLSAQDLSTVHGWVTTEEGGSFSGADVSLNLLNIGRDPCGGGGGGGCGGGGGGGCGCDGDCCEDCDGGDCDGGCCDDCEGGGCGGGGGGCGCNGDCCEDCDGGDCDGGCCDDCRGGGCGGGGGGGGCGCDGDCCEDCDGGDCDGGCCDDCRGGGCGGGGCGDGGCGGGCKGGEGCKGDDGCRGGCEHDGDRKTQSNRRGYFEFEDVEPGRYIVCVSLDGYRCREDVIMIQPDSDTEVELVIRSLEDPMSVGGGSDNLPADVSLLNTYPNPFNSTLTVSISLTESMQVKTELYDVTGQMLQTVYEGQMSTGVHNFTVNCDDLNSGIYLVKLHTPMGVVVNKVSLMK